MNRHTNTAQQVIAARYAAERDDIEARRNHIDDPRWDMSNRDMSSPGPSALFWFLTFTGAYWVVVILAAGSNSLAGIALSVNMLAFAASFWWLWAIIFVLLLWLHFREPSKPVQVTVMQAPAAPVAPAAPAAPAVMLTSTELMLIAEFRRQNEQKESGK